MTSKAVTTRLVVEALDTGIVFNIVGKTALVQRYDVQELMAYCMKWLIEQSENDIKKGNL